MKFFEQEIIRDELVEMMSLYEDIREALANSWDRTIESKRECLNKLERLVELQEFLYFRAKYSEDEEAKEFTEMLRHSAIFLGISPGMDLTQIFSEMKEGIAEAKKKLDNPA